MRTTEIRARAVMPLGSTGQIGGTSVGHWPKIEKHAAFGRVA